MTLPKGFEEFERFEEDFDIKSFLKDIIIFEEFPVIVDIVMMYRGYNWLFPYVKNNKPNHYSNYHRSDNPIW